jgi:hypothetical protein
MEMGISVTMEMEKEMEGAMVLGKGIGMEMGRKMDMEIGGEVDMGFGGL